MKVLRIILVAVCALFLARLVLILALRPEARLWLSPDYWEHQSKLGAALRLVNAHYVDADKAGLEDLSREALDAMMQSLDRYSDFLDPEEFADFEVDADQHYAGIGVEIERLNQRVTITEVFPDSPAEEAGVMSGDQIIEVDGEDARESGLREIVAMIRGPIGSSIPVTFLRPATGEEIPLALERRDVEFPTLRDAELSPKGVGYLRLTQFSRRSASELADALQALESQGMQGLILDLRGNPGGLLPVSVAVVGQFVPESTLVVSTRGREGRAERLEYTEPSDYRAHYPLIILVDDRSASASEIVSGALQDLGRAVVVGEQTVGKGSVQSVVYLDDKEAIRLTTARYYLPSGRTINEVGITPDILVEQSEDTRLRLLAQRAYRDMPEGRFEERFGIQKLPDRQRDTAESILLGILAFERPKGSDT